MLALPTQDKIYLFGEPVDMRKSFEGLTALIYDAFPTVLTRGYFTFLNRGCNRIKVLYWDEDGFVIWYKRLERGSFMRHQKGSICITRREFFLLLEGITASKETRRFRVK